MSSEKHSRRIFVALTIMAVCLVIAIFSPIDGAMPRWARVVGALFVGGAIFFFLTRTEAGRETAEDYAEGAKSTYAQGQELVRRGREMVDQGIEEGHKLIADGETLIQDHLDARNRKP